MACAIVSSQIGAVCESSSASPTSQAQKASSAAAMQRRTEETTDTPYGLLMCADTQAGTKCDQIYWRLRREETRLGSFNGDASYIQPHHTQAATPRRVLVDWIQEVSEDCNFDFCTFHTAVFYVDKLLQKYTIPEKHLQLFGLCCLNIAAKYEEAEENVPRFPELNSIAQTNFPRELLSQMEVVVLNKIGWRLNAVTPAHLLGYMSEKGLLFSNDTLCGKRLVPSVPSYLQKYVEFFCTLCAQDHAFLRYKPSVLAAAIALVSRRALIIMPMWNDKLHEVLHYTENEIRPVFLHIWLQYTDNYNRECLQADSEYQDDITAKASAHKIAKRLGSRWSPTRVTEV
eukprot:gb/GECG01016791.1/.p1 GENE.gb/GECG01016791.1/~~gb/GECG01016791.1/.p1  ORF type:complete len:343 (+),score=34.12 gb/GECG01016791.1/:1-1029(+)